MIVSIMTFRIMPHSITTYSITTFILMKLSVKYLFVILRSIALYRYRNAQFMRILFIFRSNVDILNVVMLSVVAPFLHLSDAEKKT
jgi:hypothetical protein